MDDDCTCSSDSCECLAKMDDDTMEEGLCKCGCGKKTSLATRSNKKKGLIKGKPCNYIQGHNENNFKKRESHVYWKGGRHYQNGYIISINETCSNPPKDGYVQEHRAIAEKIIGFPLPPLSVVHHINEDRSDNRPDNLVVCESHAYHLLLHKRMRAYKACGMPNYLKCSYCKQYDDPVNMFVDKTHHYHRACLNQYWRKKRIANNSLNNRNGESS